MAEHPRIGVGVTTYNRPDTLGRTLDALERWRPPNSTLTIVDDHSAIAHPEASYHRWNRGVAASKNHCLETLMADGCEHIFLFDDDTRPECDEWWVPYLESGEPHLMYQFPFGADHWDLRVIYRDDNLVAYDRPRGCMLYVQRHVVEDVGGMHLAFGRHGGEHQDWSQRIYDAGHTRFPFADVATRTLVCDDETMSGISSLPASAKQDWRHVDPSTLPRYAEYRELAVPVLVPYRSDGGHRSKLWEHLLANYWSAYPHYRIREGLDFTDGAFNRSRAINVAARGAGNWDVAVIADADTWVPIAQLDEAVWMARRTGKLVAAFSSVVELSQDYTHRLLAGFAGPMDIGTEKVRTDDIATQSSMLVVPRLLWERIGGFDEKFCGWGGDDNAFWRAATLLVGAPLRMDGSAFHLWHPQADYITRLIDPGYQKNLARWQRYADADCECSLRKVQRS